jgi:hypothetical protein
LTGAVVTKKINSAEGLEFFPVEKNVKYVPTFEGPSSYPRLCWWSLICTGGQLAREQRRIPP